MPEPSRVLRWIAIGLLLLVLVAVGLYAATNTIIGSDLWWAMATGRYITEHHEVPHQDIYSYTHAGAPWFNQEWLTQLLFFHTYRLFGGDAVAYLKIGIVLTLFLIAAWIGWRRSRSLFWTVVATFAGALVCRTYLDVRPQLFTFLGTLVVMALTEAYRRGARPWVLAFLPLTLLLWVNLHFGFIFGLGILGLIVGCECVKSLLRFKSGLESKRLRWLIAAALASVLVCLLNPQHVHAFTFPFTIMEPNTPWKMISEWLPTRLFVDEAFNPSLFGFTFVGGIAAFLLAVFLSPRRIDLTDLAITVLTAIMALEARRFVPLYTLVSTPFVATCLAIVAESATPQRLRARELSTPLRAIPAAVLALAGIASIGWTYVSKVRPIFAVGLFEGMIHAQFFPKDAVEFLRVNPMPGRLYNLYNWGGYLEYWLPERPVFIDGRAHTVYPSSFYLDNLDVHFTSPRWESILDRYEVSLVLWPKGGGDYGYLLNALQRSPNWKPVYSDTFSVVFAHVVRGREWVEKAATAALAYPESPTGQLAFYDALLSANQFDRALAALKSLIERYPDMRLRLDGYRPNVVNVARRSNDPRSWFEAGLLCDGLGDVDHAIEYYEKSLERGGQQPFAPFARRRLEELRK
ncbi:MAG: hypothetical protein HYR85_27140 [Planctomycetes bacterium]|nr:hypothetical protein [Planctomycetota bacterium]